MTDPHAPNTFQPASNGRLPEAALMSYYNQGARMEGANIPSSNAQYYMFPFRNAEQMQPVYRQINPSLMCQFAPQMQEAQLQNAVPNPTHDFSQLGITPQAYSHQIPFQHMVHSNPLLQYFPIPQPEQVKQRAAVNRERKPLIIIDPRTHNVVDLESSKSESKSVENFDVPISTEQPISQHLKNVKENVLNNEPLIVEAEESIPVTNESEKAEEIHEPVISETDNVVEIGEQIPATTTASTSEISDTDSSSDSDDSDADYAVGRRIYDRSVMLECKDSPIASVQLQELAAYFAKYSKPRKGHGMSNRPTQRVIRLPTGIAVKRIEGAFVPTKLRKEKDDGDGSEQKQLSRRLNIILNRVSESNISDTVSEIKKLKITTPEDIQMLASLIFEKGIRQQKYIKVFTQICKMLKGFEVSGSESLDVLVLRKTQELFHKSLETIITELNATIDAKIAGAKDDATKKVLEEDRETTILKKTDAYYGNVSFVSHLYLARMISVKTITECLRRLKDSQAPESLESMLILLKTCGHELDNSAKNIIDTCILRLDQIAKSDKIPLHQVYKIQELIELRARGWKELSAKSHTLQKNDKLKPYNQNPITKRRTMQSINTVTPSTLAVTQQSVDCRKLGPQFTPWGKGSGSLKYPEENAHSPANSSYRSREASPRVPAGPRGAWSTPLVPKLAAQNSKTESYADLLQRNQSSARQIVDTLMSNPDACVDVMKECKETERSALLHALLDLLMEKKIPVLQAAGVFLSRMLDMQLIQESDIVSAYGHFFQGCDEEWLEDYPLGWKYVAEVLQYFIQKDDCRFTLLSKILSPIRCNNWAATVMAHCLSLSMKRIDTSILNEKWHSCDLSWSSFGLSPENSTFISKQFKDLEFTLDNEQQNGLKCLLDELTLVLESPTHENITNYFRRVSLSDVPPAFIPSCIRILVSKSKDYARAKIDQLVMGLGIVVDHNPGRESQVLQGLQECSVGEALTDKWIKSLVDKKVISSDAIDTWKASGKMNDLVARSNPVRDL